MIRTVHLIYVVDDGVATLRCGVGAIAMNFFLAVPKITDHFQDLGIQLRLSVISIAAHSGAIGIRDDLLKRTKQLCSSLNGELRMIAPLVRPGQQYFNYPVWEQYNREASRIIDTLIDSVDTRTIVLANDTIFSHIRLRTPGVWQVWIPHSLSIVHAQSYAEARVREAWEREAVSYHHHLRDGYVGYISPYVKRILKEVYSLTERKLVSFGNGFSPTDILDRTRYSPGKIRKMLLSRGIPTNLPLLLSYARADEYKGLDISARVMITLAKTMRYHGVLIASRFSNEDIVDQVQSRLRRILMGQSSRITAFFGYEFDLPKYLLRYSQTRMLLHLPSRDFCPLVPFEAEMIGHQELCVVNSDIPCFSGLINDRYDGFLVRGDSHQITRGVSSILSMPRAAREAIVLNGKERTHKVFDIRKNYYVGLSFLLNDMI